MHALPGTQTVHETFFHYTQRGCVRCDYLTEGGIRYSNRRSRSLGKPLLYFPLLKCPPFSSLHSTEVDPFVLYPACEWKRLHRIIITPSCCGLPGLSDERSSHPGQRCELHCN